MKSAWPEQGFLIKGRVGGISQPRCFYKPEEERQKHRKKIIFLTSFQKGILFRFPLARLKLSFLSLPGFSPFRAIPVHEPQQIQTTHFSLHLSPNAFKILEFRGTKQFAVGIWLSLTPKHKPQCGNSVLHPG